ncbi:MAG TPA: hypothetical protein VNO55_30315 [Polyangia bacterium]|nr:hypothetical protein [Polyangia bacterium]
MSTDDKRGSGKNDRNGNGSGNGNGERDSGGHGAATPGNDAPELIIFPGSRRMEEAGRLQHLRQHRRLIVRRSLLATVVGGVVPIPVADEYIAGRVRAGMLMNIAERRQVDLALSSAELLADPREGTAMRNATLTAATLLALKLAWKKFFAVLAIGRRAEDMATTFQMGTLFDHFCAKLHVGSGLDRTQAIALRAVIQGSLAETERSAVVAIFREGGRIMGRSMLEAPAWVSGRFQKAAENWVQTGGQPGVTLDQQDSVGPAPAEARWLDRATATVEDGLGRLGNSYLETLVTVFEKRWRQAEAAREKVPEGTPSAPPVGG